ncbi:MAG: serine hydrolase [Bacteroidia bacterium]|nr:serine hydrolase [Bacteroidia bacterium]
MPQIKKYYSYVLVAITCATGGFAVSGIFKNKPTQKKEAVVQTTTVSAEENNAFSLINKSLNSSYQNEGIRELEPFSSLIEDYITKAKQKNPEILISYYFRDLDNGIWIGINEKEEFAPASLFKLPLMLAILKEAESNPAILSATYQYFAKDFVGLDKGDEGFEKKDGSFYSLDELI